MSYYCFICKTLIRGNMFRAYDQNLCSPSCREHLIKKFNFNYNYKLKEKKENPIKKSVSCIKFIEKQQPEPQDAEPKYKSFAYDDGESTCINLYQVFNIILLVLKQEITGPQNYENHKRRISINIYTSSYSDLTFRNMFTKVIQKAKNFSIY